MPSYPELCADDLEVLHYLARKRLTRLQQADVTMRGRIGQEYRPERKAAQIAQARRILAELERCGAGAQRLAPVA